MQPKIAWAATVTLVFFEGALQMSGYSNTVLAVALLGGAAIAAAVGAYLWREERLLTAATPVNVMSKLPIDERRLLGLVKNGVGVLGSVPPRGRDGQAFGVKLETFHAMLDRLITLDVLRINQGGGYELTPLGREVVQLVPGHDGTITESLATPQDPPDVAPKFLSLRDLFDTDFAGYGANIKEIMLGGGPDVPNVLCYLFFDDRANSRFLSAYVKKSAHAKDVCIAIAERCDEIVNLVAQGLDLVARRVGSSVPVSSKDATFTKRVFLYHETDFSLPDLGEIATAFQKNGILMEPRGPQYHSIHMLEKRDLPTSRPAL